jgi:hypothetical protein
LSGLGGYFFALNFRIKITRAEKAIIIEIASYTLMASPPFEGVANRYRSATPLTILAVDTVVVNPHCMV